MAKEFKHGTVGTELTQTEWEGEGTHVIAGQATGDLPYASSPTQLTGLAIGSSNDVLRVSGGVPDWQATTFITALGTIATGVWEGTDVGVAHGGTGVSTLTANGVLIGNGTSAITSVDMSTKGKILIGDGSGNPQMLSVGTNNHVLTADSGETTGVKWAAPAAAAAGSLTGSTLASGVTTSSLTAVGTIATGVWQGTDIGVAYGGTGVSTLTDGGVLLGSGTGAITAMAVLADGEMIVGDGSTDPVAESGATLRTSIGVGTGDTPQFTAIELGHASDTTIARSGSGAITVEGTQVLLAGAALTGTTGTFSGVLDITDATDSSDASGDTGALRTEGGASIAKKLYVGTDASVLGALYVGAGGNEFSITESSDDITIKSLISDKDLKISGNDGGSNVDALSFDMSDAGAATFGGAVDLGSNTLTSTGSMQIRTIDYSDGDLAMTIADGGGVTFAQDATFSGAVDLSNNALNNVGNASNQWDSTSLINVSGVYAYGTGNKQVQSRVVNTQSVANSATKIAELTVNTSTGAAMVYVMGAMSGDDGESWMDVVILGSNAHSVIKTFTARGSSSDARTYTHNSSGDLFVEMADTTTYDITTYMLEFGSPR